MDRNEKLLEVDQLSVGYGNGEMAVCEVSFSVPKGGIMAIVGESGSGKSTLIRAVMGLLPAGGRIESGRIRFDGRDLAGLSREETRRIRGEEIGMIFQNAGEYLNPRRKIGSQYLEAMKYHLPLSKEERREEALRMLSSMKLPDPERIMRSYPFQLSGGMRQRAAIAMAMSLSPRLLMADEPTSALDVTVQAQVVQEMVSMREKFGTAIVLVTHNLGVAARIADQIMVLRRGKVMELGSRDQVIKSPKSDYTRELLAAVPELEGNQVG